VFYLPHAVQPITGATHQRPIVHGDGISRRRGARLEIVGMLQLVSALAGGLAASGASAVVVVVLLIGLRKIGYFQPSSARQRVQPPRRLE